MFLTLLLLGSYVYSSQKYPGTVALLAAAPELLIEANELIAEFFEEYEHAESAPENSPTVQAIRRLQAVIRKAKGEL